MKEKLRNGIRWGLKTMGIPESVRPHLQDKLIRGAKARLRAMHHWGTMWIGTELYFPRPGCLEIGLVELPSPGSREVLVAADYTAISPGTERALYSLMPGVNARFPLRPGYSGTGKVIRVGSRVRNLKPGDTVACTETMYHSSLSLLQENKVFPLPAGVHPEDAAFLHLLVIAHQAIQKGKLRPGESVAVIGAGVIGQFSLQIAQCMGGKSPVMIAASSSKRDLSVKCGATRFIDLSRDPLGAGTLSCDLVIEATGNPDALIAATQAAAPGGRIVLVGSSRGINRDVNLDALLRTKEITLIGAHISTVPEEQGHRGQPSYQEQARQVLAILETHQVNVGDLVTHKLHPYDAGLFYRKLSRGDHSIVGAIIEWHRLEERQKCRRSFILAPPHDLFMRGRSFNRDDGPPSVINKSTSWLVDGLNDLPTSNGSLRFGLIGCGGMGARHAQAIRSTPNARLVAAMDLDENLARDVARGGFYTTKIEELFSRPDVDAVIIVTPNHLHESLGRQAALAGKHVIVEKPMAHNLESAGNLLSACLQAEVALSVGYSFRYAPEIRVARRIVEEELLGQILSVQMTCYMDKPPSYYGSGYTNRTHSDWRQSRDKAGGGILIMNMSHQLDQIRYILGRDIVRLNSVAGNLDAPDGIDVEDVISVSTEFEGGTIGNFFGACFARGINNLVEIRIMGESGSIMLDRPFRFMTLHSRKGITPGRWHAFGSLPKVDVQVMYLARFCDAVLKGRPPEISGKDGIAIQSWIESIYRSAYTGRPAEVTHSPSVAPARISS